MKPLHGGKVGAFVKDVFDHIVRSALHVQMEGLRLLAETLSSASLSRTELKETRRGEGENTKKCVTYY